MGNWLGVGFMGGVPRVGFMGELPGVGFMRELTARCRVLGQSPGCRVHSSSLLVAGTLPGVGFTGKFQSQV